MDLSERGDLKVAPQVKGPGEATNRFFAILCYNNYKYFIISIGAPPGLLLVASPR